MSDDTLTIRQMCDAYDVTARTLRFYEAKELLFPIRQGTRRLFTRKDQARLKLIMRGKRFGFSLEEIRQILDLYDPKSQNLAQMKRAFDIGRQRLADMTRQRDELEDAIMDLKSQLSWGEQVIASLTNPQTAVG